MYFIRLDNEIRGIVVFIRLSWRKNVRQRQFIHTYAFKRYADDRSIHATIWSAAKSKTESDNSKKKYKIHMHGTRGTQSMSVGVKLIVNLLIYFLSLSFAHVPVCSRPCQLLRLIWLVSIRIHLNVLIFFQVPYSNTKTDMIRFLLHKFNLPGCRYRYILRSNEIERQLDITISMKIILSNYLHDFLFRPTRVFHPQCANNFLRCVSQWISFVCLSSACQIEITYYKFSQTNSNWNEQQRMY